MPEFKGQRCLFCCPVLFENHDPAVVKEFLMVIDFHILGESVLVRTSKKPTGGLWGFWGLFACLVGFCLFVWVFPIFLSNLFN